MGSLFISNATEDPRFFFAVVITVVISIVLHELAHGWTAVKFGDDTPYYAGHMTLNPLVHMGGFSLAMLAIAGIAWGAMPVDPTRMRGKYAEMWVALAGPATNVLLAIGALLGLGIWERFSPNSGDAPQMIINAKYLLMIFGQYNLALAMFNLLPVPPLDGSRVAWTLVPAYRRLLDGEIARGIMLAIFVAMFMGGGQYLFLKSMEGTLAALSFVSGLPGRHFLKILFPEAL